MPTNADLPSAEFTDARLMITNVVGFMEASRGLLSIKLPSGEIHYPVFYVNLGYAIELIFKAYLLYTNATDRAGLKNLGHDLIRLAAECESAGLRPSDATFSQLVAILAPLHRSHRLRYLEDRVDAFPEDHRLAHRLTWEFIHEAAAQMPALGLPKPT